MTDQGTDVVAAAGRLRVRGAPGLLSGGQGYVIGTFVGVLIQGLIQTYITFDGTLSSWWTRIVIGALLCAFCLLQRVIERHAARRKSGGTPTRERANARLAPPSSDTASKAEPLAMTPKA